MACGDTDILVITSAYIIQCDADIDVMKTKTWSNNVDDKKNFY